MIFKALCPLVPVLLLLTACSTSAAGSTRLVECYPDHADPNPMALRRDLNAAEARWHAAGIHSYQYDASIIAFLRPGEGGPARYVVQNDQTISLTVANGGSTQLFPSDGTMEAQFARIRSTLSQPFDPQRCEDFQVQYDPSDGHVTSITSQYATSRVSDTYVQRLFKHFTRL